MKTLFLILMGLLLFLALSVAAIFVWARFSDGPKGPIPGGALTTGEYRDAVSVDWQEVLGERAVVEIELQLENPVGSRTTGAFVYEGQLYVPCDLGYVWRRLPNGAGRLLLHTIWLFKDWHTDVEADGRVVVRANGVRYKLEATRVTDETLLEVFRQHVSAAAADAFELLDVQTDPNDIWFFRLDPRAS